MTGLSAVSLRTVTTAEPDQWRALLPAGRSAFGSLEFARITEAHSDRYARLLVFADGEVTVVSPTFLRPVSSLPFAEGGQSVASDSVSPDYTGPIVEGPLTPETARAFRERLAAYCRRERIVAEFAHLHPWSGRAELFIPQDVSLDRAIVYVDLRLSQEQLWHESFSYACRKNIRRALNERVRVAQAATPEDVHEFHRIYTETMDRRGALARYGFPVSYFMAFFRHMSDHATFFLARYGHRVVAATLYLHDDVDVYSYLGGADHAVQHVRPTNAIVHEAIRWAHRHGKRRLILGGGYQPDDGIYRFKASFSPLRTAFHVYRRIQIPDDYARLCRGWSAYYDLPADASDYFPAYRSVPVTAGHPQGLEHTS